MIWLLLWLKRGGVREKPVEQTPEHGMNGSGGGKCLTVNQRGVTSFEHGHGDKSITHTQTFWWHVQEISRCSFRIWRSRRLWFCGSIRCPLWRILPSRSSETVQIGMQRLETQNSVGQLLGTRIKFSNWTNANLKILGRKEQTNLDGCAKHPKHDSYISCERSRWPFQHITLLHTSRL